MAATTSLIVHMLLCVLLATAALCAPASDQEPNLQTSEHLSENNTAPWQSSTTAQSAPTRQLEPGWFEQQTREGYDLYMARWTSAQLYHVTATTGLDRSLENPATITLTFLVENEWWGLTRTSTALLAQMSDGDEEPLGDDSQWGRWRDTNMPPRPISNGQEFRIYPNYFQKVTLDQALGVLAERAPSNMRWQSVQVEEALDLDERGESVPAEIEQDEAYYVFTPAQEDLHPMEPMSWYYVSADSGTFGVVTAPPESARPTIEQAMQMLEQPRTVVVTPMAPGTSNPQDAPVRNTTVRGASLFFRGH